MPMKPWVIILAMPVRRSRPPRASRHMEVQEGVRSVTEAMEDYLASASFSDALDTAYKEAKNKYGSTDSRVPAVVLHRTCSRVLASPLPAPLHELPAPDAEFIERAIASVLPKLADSGVRSLDELEIAVQAVLLNLAAATDRLADIDAKVIQDKDSDSEDEKS
jgi:hypothetical protein